MSEVSDRILELIKDQRISYRELEAATGLKRATLQRYATGKSERIPMDSLEKIAMALHVTPSYLMGWGIENKSDAVFAKRKLLFDLSAKATEEDIDKIIQMVDIMIGDK